jgi:lipopolysaccharide exporter
VSVARKAVRGAVWTVLTGVGGRFVSVLGTLILTYFLHPAVVGQVAEASILAMTAGQLSQFGFGQYLVVHRDLDRRGIFQISVMTIGMASLMLGLLCAIALPLASARGNHTLVEYLPGVALAVFLFHVGFVPEKMLIREMRFGFVGVVRGLGELTYAVVAVGLAWWGLGGLAVVFGLLASAALKMSIFTLSVPRRDWLEPHPFDRGLVRRVLGFGAPLWAASAAQFVSRNWDNLLVGRLFGDATMGLYKQAYNLADIPTAQVGEAIGDVLLPSFARVDDEAKARTLVRSSALLALIVFPLAVGLGAVADTLVAAIFNAQWQGLAPFLTILAALSVTRPVGWIVSSYLQSRGRTRVIMVLDIGRAFAVLASILALSPLGPLAAAAGVGIAFGLHALASLWAVRLIDQVPASAILASMVGPLLACGAMVAAVLGVRQAYGELGPVPGLAIEIAVGAATYVAACFVVARRTTRDALALLRSAFGRRPAAG